MNNMEMLYVVPQVIMCIFFTIYIVMMIKDRKSNEKNVVIDTRKEEERLCRMRRVRLNIPLNEIIRPRTLDKIVGQEKGIEMLKSCLCGKNPQHILIYGPAGVGKTAAARAVFDEIKKSAETAFKKDAPFVEIDATTLHYDERNIADPLIGSVHDPIYQGAGAFGSMGVPQPKAGAVSKAHGGILFIDEIGELPAMQINRLLKVLEDRCVHFESSYYSRTNTAIPEYIHDIFENGMPADFRMIGATTRKPSEIPDAIRSRCIEIFFEPLGEMEIRSIAENAFKAVDIGYSSTAVQAAARYCVNGRNAVNLISCCASKAIAENRKIINENDVICMAEQEHLIPKYTKTAEEIKTSGFCYGLAVADFRGIIAEIEADVRMGGSHYITVNGIVGEEEINSGHGVLKRKGTALESVYNAVVLLERNMGIDRKNYGFTLNFSGCLADGPSAGTAVYCAMYSAVNNINIPDFTAMTGEISISGRVLPVGGVFEKIKGAYEAGIKRVFIPKANMEDRFSEIDIEIIPVEDVSEITEVIFSDNERAAESA